MRMRRLKAGALFCVLAATVSTGCDPDIPEREGEPVDRVEAIFDPDSGVIPLPNDAAMEDGFLPTLEGAGAESAQGEFLNYLPRLRGWLTSTPIEIPFSGPLDEDSLDGAVRFYTVDEGELTTADIGELIYEENEDGTSVVRVVPAEPVERGQQYAVAVTKDAEGANGISVGEPLAMFFAASRQSLLDEEGQPAVSVLIDQPAQAIALEGLRLHLAPVFESLEEQGIERDELAVAFRWTVTPDAAAAFDPDAANVPLPNTLALDADGTFPAAGTCHAGAPTSQGYFDTYLASLSGWPDVTPIKLPLTAPVDEATVTAESVQLFRLEEGAWAKVDEIEVNYRTESVDNCSGETVDDLHIEIIVPGGMKTREQYFAFATREITSVDGEGLLPEVPMYMGMQPYPLVDENGASLVGNLSDAQAQGIAGIQAVLAPAMEVIAQEAGLDHEDLASVWSWYTWNDTFVVFDPTAGQVPFPNAFLMGDDGTVDLPIDEDADPLTLGILTTLNERPGFSTTAPGWIPVDGAVDPSTVGYASVAMAPENGASTQLLAEEDYTVRYEEEWGHIVVEPTTPLEPKKLHAGIVTQDMLGANGRPVQPSPAFVFLRSPYPLWTEASGSLVDQLDDVTAATLEVARQEYGQLFFLALIIDGQRFSRERIVNAWAFTTEDPVEAMQEYRALAREIIAERGGPGFWRACDNDDSCGDEDAGFVSFDSEEFEDPNQPGVSVDVSNLEAAHFQVEFDTVTLSMATNEVLDGGERVGVSVYVPREIQGEGDCETPFDVVIAQHGLGADRWQAGLGQANELAAFPNCMATVAMDFPLHGGRALDVGTLHPTERPANSGEGFLTANLLAAKANFAQAIMDLFVLTRLLEGDTENGLEAVMGALAMTGPYFSDRIGYVGVSLGGILGVPFVSLEQAVDTAVINGAGGRLTWMLEGDEEGPSTIGGPILAAFEQMGMVPGMFEFIRTMVMVQWVADWIDPFAYAPTAVSGDRRNLEADEDGVVGPVIGASCETNDECPVYWRCDSVEVDEVQQDRCVEYLPPVQVMVQMVEGDRTIVNRSTEALAAALGVSLEHTTYSGLMPGGHAFMTVRDEAHDYFEAGVCARNQAAEWLRSGLQDGEAVAGEEYSPAVCVE